MMLELERPCRYSRRPISVAARSISTVNTVSKRIRCLPTRSRRTGKRMLRRRSGMTWISASGSSSASRSGRVGFEGR